MDECHGPAATGDVTNSSQVTACRSPATWASQLDRHRQGWAQTGEFSTLTQRSDPKLDVMVHAYSLSTQGDEAVKARLGYIANLRPALVA